LEVIVMFKQIVAGVDASDAGAAAAATAYDLAQRMPGAQVRLVHVAQSVPMLPPTLRATVDLATLEQDVVDGARRTMEDALRDRVPAAAIEALDVRRGRAAWILPLIVRELHADLLVLGGRHHSVAERWFIGSTAHHAVRVVDVPTLIVVPERTSIHKILVAADLSQAAGEVLRWAKQLAALWKAQVRIVHIVEPVPYYGEYPLIVDHAEFVQWAKDHFQSEVGRLWQGSEADRVVREGPVAGALDRECEEWQADLLVLGSHGKGWLDRMLIGSTTQRMLSRLPTSLFIAPIGPPSSD
jgi:nucleotide-binding universal stress UspA family protein